MSLAACNKPAPLPGRAPLPVCMPADMKCPFLDFVRGHPDRERYVRDQSDQEKMLASMRGLPLDYCEEREPMKECKHEPGN